MKHPIYRRERKHWQCMRWRLVCIETDIETARQREAALEKQTGYRHMFIERGPWNQDYDQPRKRIIS